MEIRNVTPQCQNTPVFGMAFLKPLNCRGTGRYIEENAEEAMKAFEAAVFNGKSQKSASKALRALVDKHANDKYYNSKFIADKQNSNGYSLQILDMNKRLVEEIGGDYRSSEFGCKKTNDKVSGLTLSGLSFFGKVKAYFNAVVASISDKYRKYKNPIAELPEPFQILSAKVEALEKAERAKESNLKFISALFKDA